MAEVLKTLFSEGSFHLKKAKCTPRQHRVTYSTQLFHETWKIEVSNGSLL